MKLFITQFEDGFSLLILGRLSLYVALALSRHFVQFCVFSSHRPTSSFVPLGVYSHTIFVAVCRF
jgi:hypothetical protein